MDKTRVLFVCLGNICRSPAAEAVFTAKVRNAGLQDKFLIDSAGTSGWHSGEKADRRMQSHAVKRGYELTSLSRKFNSEADFGNFDFIVAMDNENLETLKKWVSFPGDRKKLYKMTDFRREYRYNEIPDPYYGGGEGFELVLDLLEDSCEGLLAHILNQDRSTI